MGETLLSGLVRAGRRVDKLLVGREAARAGPRARGAVRRRRRRQRRGRRARPTPSRWWSSRRTWATLLEEIARELRRRPAAGLAGGRHHHRVHRVAACPRASPWSGSCPTRRRWSTRAWPRSRPGSHCDEAHLAEAEALMASVGQVLRVPERQQDAVTAICGSGPAYIFFVVESMIEAGVHLGPAARHRHRAGRPDPGRLGQDAAGDRHPPDRAARAGHLAGRHHRLGAARAGDPQGARRVPGGHGGGPRPVAASWPEGT